MNSKILTIDEVLERVSACSGTWIKRRNLRKRLINQSNNAVIDEILTIKAKIRDLRALGAREGVLRYWYSQVTKFELMLLR